MPRSTVAEATLYPLPEQVVFDATLLACEEVSVPFIYKSGKHAGEPGEFQKWEWTFLITSDNREYDGVEAKGSTEPKITDANENDGFLSLARPWVEALKGRELEVGEDVDTDDLLALPCKLTVRHDAPRARKTGDGFWYNVSVDEVFSADSTQTPRAPAPAAEGDPWAAAAAGVEYSEPPF